MGKFDTGDFLLGAAQGTLTDIQEAKRQKQEMMLALLKSGAYQPATGNQNTNFGQRFSSNFMGPNLNSNNPNLLGMPLQRVTPEMQAEQIKQQMSAYGNLLGNSQGGAPGLQPSFSLPLPGQAGVKMMLKPPSAASQSAAQGATDYQRIMNSQPGDRDYKIAEALASGKITPQFFRTLGGYGQKGSEARRALFEKASQINPNFDESQFEIGFSGAKSAANKFEGNAALVESFSKTARKNLDLALSFSKKVDRGGAPAITKVYQAYRQGYNQDPTLKAFKNIVLTATNEYAKVMTGQTGGAAVSDTASAKAEELLSSTDSPESFEAAVNVMYQEMDNRLAGITEQRQDMRGQNSNMAGGQGNGQGKQVGKYSLVQ